jgi:hypothetical protein
MKRRLTGLLVVGALAALAILSAGCGAATTSSDAADGGAVSRPGSGGPDDVSAAIKGALDGLVTQGTITASQESAVLDALVAQRPGGQQGRPGAAPSDQPTPQGSPAAPADGPPGGNVQPQDIGTMFADALDTLVEDGTISSAQEQAVLDALTAALPQPTGAPGEAQSATAAS